MRFLVVTASFGTGHNQVADALAGAAVQGGDTAEICDALAVSMPTVNALFTRGFIQLLTTAPGLYRLAYNQAEIPGRWAGIKHSSLGTMGRVMWPKLLPLLTRFQPDAILCTHPFPLGAMA
ncbi:MAG: MGDG synthase family glycosyltransferase, partial [Mycobacterium leprae]